MEAFSKEEVIERVNRSLGTHQSAEMSIEVVERLIRADGDRWYVPVRPTTYNPITYSYFGVLTDAAILTMLMEHAQAAETLSILLIAADQRLLRAAAAEGLVTLNPELASPADVPALLAAL